MDALPAPRQGMPMFWREYLDGNDTAAALAAQLFYGDCRTDGLAARQLGRAVFTDLVAGERDRFADDAGVFRADGVSAADAARPLRGRMDRPAQAQGGADRGGSVYRGGGGGVCGPVRCDGAAALLDGLPRAWPARRGRRVPHACHAGDHPAAGASGRAGARRWLGSVFAVGFVHARTGDRRGHVRRAANAAHSADGSLWRARCGAGRRGCAFAGA